MKSLIGMLILMVCIWPAAAAAQIGTEVIFSTKFPFTAGNTKFQPGGYTIRPLGSEPDVFEITSADGKAAAMFETLTTDLPSAPSTSEVVFRKYGDQYVLGEIHKAGSRTGLTALKSHAERQHAKKSGAPTKETVRAANKS